MNTRLACSDFTFPLLPHEDALQLVSMLGFEGVDIGLFEERSHLWPSREFDDVPRSARTLKEKLDDVGLEPADVFLQMAMDFVPYAINHPERTRRQRARDWFLKSLEYAAECGCAHVTALPGVHYRDEKRADSFSRAVDELNWRVARAREHDIVFGVEAHVGSLVPRPKSAERLVQTVPGLTLTLDYTHFTKIGLPDSDVEPLMKYASHFHARGARRGRLQTTFDHNVIDYRRIVEVMRDSGYRGWLGIEYIWIDWEHCNECDTLSETVRFRDFFRSMK
ncbi:MAG: sugar phosphate isomerase/epimerase [Candidatus Latescibacteria bacterium]|nr:sugar phosphate isomerase/epimerase [Candidatus Latescibacterota bacterium]